MLYSDLKNQVDKVCSIINNSALKVKSQLIAIWAEKTVETILLLPAILKSGGGYIPLNVDWPMERIEFVLQSTGTECLIVDEGRISLASELLEKINISYTREILSSNMFMLRLKQNHRIRLKKDVSYVLFTSGSTGFPKGIVHTQLSALTFLNWCIKEFKSYKIKRHVSIAPLNFDLSVYDVFYPLLTQSTLFVPNSAIISNTRMFAKYVSDHKIESLYTTPSYLNLLEQTGKLAAYNFSHVKLILLAGEVLSYDLVHRLKAHFTKATFYNLYGPTETNVCSAYKIDLKKRNSEFVPIGKSILKGNLKISKQGELLYKGKLLMSGYINEKGFHALRKGAVYKTGDYVKADKNGLLCFIGRKDNLIKRKGFRIELNEINAALRNHSEVNACESLFVKEEELIVSFVESAHDLSQLALKTFCLKHLPSYMIPDLIVVLRKIPVNLNHKADLSALRNIYAQTFKS